MRILRLFFSAMALFATFLSPAQPVPKFPDYTADWQQADALMEQGKPQSARQIADRIYTQAMAAKNYVQVTKAALLRQKYRAFGDEDETVNLIAALRRDVAVVPEPTRSVLRSALADTYWQYFQQNRYKFYNRTAQRETAEKPEKTGEAEFLLWDARRLVAEVTAGYVASVEEAPATLQKTPVGDVAPLLETPEKNPNAVNARALRPTLYDLLAHKALDFFRNTEPDILKPTYRFTLDQPTYFAPAAEFATASLRSPDTLSGKFQALRLFQQLIQFHLADKDPAALADVDADRLTFVYQYATLPDKAGRYVAALETAAKRYVGQPAEAEYGFALAQHFVETAGQYDPLKGDAHKGDRARAVALYRDLAQRFPKTVPGQNAARFLPALLAPALTAQVEEVNLPDQPFRARVSYHNVATVMYRIYKLSPDERRTLGNLSYGNDEKERSARFKTLLARPLVAEGQQALPDDSDYNTHAVEMPLKALPLGHYALLISADGQFSLAKGETAVAGFAVSRLGYVRQQNDAGNGGRLYVMNRQTGQPLANVTVQRWTDADGRGGERYVAADSRTTDAQGQFWLPVMNVQRHFYRLTLGGDVLDTDVAYDYYRGQSSPETEQIRVQFFTDRAIYRPGQPIYWKGLVYTGKTNNYAVTPGQKLLVTFRDANGEEVAKQTVTANDFGTFSGQFTAPVGRLTGMMSLQTPYGGTSVRVEEYKRPTFAVTADPLKGAAKLGQTVRISAKAATFAGAVVEGATVRYRVTRQYIRPYWDFFWRSGRPFREIPDAEIANGETETDANGMVKVQFLAEPDATLDRAENLRFQFRITFDVTDKAGETRSATQTLSLGYSALNATLLLPDRIAQGTKETFAVTLKNAAGEPVNVASGNVQISRITPPARPLRERLWERPDRYVLSRAEFEKLFPNDPYADDDNPKEWPRNVVKTDQPQRVNVATLPPGHYVAEVTATDSTGETARQTVYFSVVNPAAPQPRPGQWVQVEKDKAEPGEIATFWVGGDAPGGWVLMTVAESGKALRTEWLQTGGQARRVTLPVTEAQRGSFSVTFARVRNGRLAQESHTVDVPFTNKQLTVLTETFRDKLKPGQPEEWTLRIDGPAKDKVLAELAATLYDASLDQFVKHNWATTFYRALGGTLVRWESGVFDAVSTYELVRRKAFPERVVRQYDRLLNTYSYGTHYYTFSAVPTGASVRQKGATRAMDAAAPQQMASVQAADANAEEVIAAPNKEQETETATSPPPLRTDFRETAFFFPHLRTDSAGRVVVRFTMPDALTRWRLLTFAHTPDLKTGAMEREIVTQKELMVTINAPRFLREGDTLRLTARLDNLSGKPLTGTAKLELFDALTGESIQNRFSVDKSFALSLIRSFTINQSEAFTWSLPIPAGLPPVAVRVTATAGQFTDGEQRVLPVLPSRTLVTDTRPFWVNGTGAGKNVAKEFRLEPLATLKPGQPVQHERLTVEVTSNPAWYALQTLPYLMEYPYDCAEQVFSKLYANALGAHILNRQPQFRAVVQQWQANPPRNPLAANAELKAVSLENTPWLADATSEAERTARLGLLLDANRLADEQARAIAKLRQMQLSDGGLPWFSGMRSSLSISLHVLAGLGHLQRLGATFSPARQADVAGLQDKVLRYVDAEMSRLITSQKKRKTGDVGPYWAVQYLYARQFYPKLAIPAATQAYLLPLVRQHWLKQSLQGQALSALVLHRAGDVKTAKSVLASLRERARQSEELGMYWPANAAGTFWYQTPIETQAYLIEAFGEIAQDNVAIDEMRKWLIRQKQTQSWSSTKATTEAVYALLLRGTDWNATSQNVSVRIGNVALADRATSSELATGYQKTTFAPAEITPALGTVTISKQGAGPSWGAVYWQHFEPLDKVTASDHKDGLRLEKAIFLQRNTPAGPQLTPITNATSLKPGDLLKVHVVLRADRAMEYVHLKDGRASGFEPVAVLSGYRYQNGLGYYEAPRDASTDFFMEHLPVGTHVFEYELRVVHGGDFSAGVATVQCFYAPEFSAHSAGSRVKVK